MILEVCLEIAETGECMAHVPALPGCAESRADLLALVRNLPNEALDRQPEGYPQPIRAILRHIGNAEEWYASRVVPAEELPKEWENDARMEIFSFLDMERRTVSALFRALSAQDRAQVFHPARWTRHPEEAWTARKALRRLLEHEREHTGHLHEVVAER